MLASSIWWSLLLVRCATALAHPRDIRPMDRLEARQAQPKPPPSFYARIMPLGASIVFGVGSSTGTGFRKPLRDTMRQDGWNVNMVGAHITANMTDSNVEAHSGYHIHEMFNEVDKSIKSQPNIIVMNLGTNDGNNNVNISTAHERYSALFNKLQDQIPGVTIVVSTLLPKTGNRDVLNNQLRNITTTRRLQGQKIVLTDVDVPTGWFTADHISSDGIHPHDEGHRRLAALFYRGIREAWNANMINPPADTGMSDEPGNGGGGGNTCEKQFGDEQGPRNTQTGAAGVDDGIYSHSSQSQGITWTYNGGAAGTNYTFARLTEPFGKHDFVHINPVSSGGTPELGYYKVYPATGQGGWGGGGSPKEVRLADGCIFRGVRFADVNADGLDDMLCVGLSGDTYVSINKGNYQFDGPRLWKSNVGSAQDRVRLADIDGDGRADYCVLANNGDISCWRNGGQGDLADYWQELGVVFTGKNMGDLNGVRFADINGDGRDDWLWVDDFGRITTWTNNRGCTKGTLAPLWRVAATSPTHGGMGQNVGRANIHVVNVFNSPSAFGLGGRGDYVWVEKQSSGNLNFRVWKNTGGGATQQKADGSRYCKMKDRPNNAEDFLWISTDGVIRIYESLGGVFPVNSPWWGPNYIFWRAIDYAGHNIDRRDLHLADWDGDGLCDIIYVNPDTGLMDGLWLNKFKTTNNLNTANNWVRVNNAGPRGGNTPCPEKRGVGIYDLAVRFADIDGNGHSDYLCIEKNGRTWGYLNNGASGLTYVSQFKRTENLDRANFRYVDVDGDGRADLVWTDKFNGDARVWRNRGRIQSGESAFTWDDKGRLYQGQAQGSCEHFPDLDGDGRADLHILQSVENTAQTWFNVCPVGGPVSNGDDADTFTTPKIGILSVAAWTPGVYPMR